MSLSYRIRGKDARTMIKKMAKPIVLNPTQISLPPKNMIALIKLLKRIAAYSAINIIANPPPLYSTLKPETSSDSPSTKSKGARLVSANIHTTQTMNITLSKLDVIKKASWNLAISCSIKLPTHRETQKNTNPMGIS